MLKTSLASILALAVLLALVASIAPAAPAIADTPLASFEEGSPHDIGWLGPLWALCHGLFGGEALGAMPGATCNAEDPCAPNACQPEFCACDPDPCAQNACNPEACTEGGDGGGQGGRFEPGG